MELIVGTTRLQPAMMELTDEGVIAEINGTQLTSVLDASHGTMTVELLDVDGPARPMAVAEIHMHGASSTVTLHYAGSPVTLN